MTTFEKCLLTVYALLLLSWVFGGWLRQMTYADAITVYVCAAIVGLFGGGYWVGRVHEQRRARDAGRD